MSAPSRPLRTQAIDDAARRSGIDAPMIERLVDSFYASIRADPVLGPIFDERIHDWAGHLGTMKRFWSSVALMTGEYHGEPMAKHGALPVGSEHFDRWLDLFRAAAETVCPPEAAAFFTERAGRIARSLEMGIAVARGALLRSGERLETPACE